MGPGIDRSDGLIARRLVIAMSAFTGVTALLGGLALMIASHGASWLPIALLAPTAFESFLVPGLVLSLTVGAPSLACSLFAWRRSGAAIDLTLLAGGALSLWIVTEIAQLRVLDVLQLIYGGLGLSLFGLGVWSAKRSAAPRHRFVLFVTSAEALGFAVPVAAGILSARYGLAPPVQLGLLIAAGFVEGLCLGFGQASALRHPVRRLRFALWTGLGAAAAWGAFMVASLEQTVPLFVFAAVVGLGAVGGLQWLELRHHFGRAHRWIGWTALAWLLALPLSFLPSPLVDEATPTASLFALWLSSGLLMAYVMALITWQGAKRLVWREASS